MGVPVTRILLLPETEFETDKIPSEVLTSNVPAGKTAEVLPEIGRLGAIPRCCQGRDFVK